MVLILVYNIVVVSQNVSLVNTVLATITASAFREFSEAIEAGESPRSVAQRALKDSWKVRSPVFCISFLLVSYLCSASY